MTHPGNWCMRTKTNDLCNMILYFQERCEFGELYWRCQNLLNIVIISIVLTNNIVNRLLYLFCTWAFMFVLRILSILEIYYKQRRWKSLRLKISINLWTFYSYIMWFWQCVMRSFDEVCKTIKIWWPLQLCFWYNIFTFYIHKSQIF